MPYIPLEEHLPGITGLLEYRKDSAEPIRALTQLLLRGPSTLTEAEREMIATIVSYRNCCKFCTAAHTAAADLLLGEKNTTRQIKEDLLTAPVSEKMKALLTIAAQVQQVAFKEQSGFTLKQLKGNFLYTSKKPGSMICWFKHPAHASDIPYTSIILL